jgi:uncharacterized protein (DUF697 family)
MKGNPVNEKNVLTKEQQNAVVAICFMAALADGGRNELERAELRRIAEKFPEADSPFPETDRGERPSKESLAQAATALNTPALRALAYEMAVCVCRADDITNEAERDFLESLRRELALDIAPAENFRQQAEALNAEAPGDEQGQTGAAAQPPPEAAGRVDEAAIDQTILRYAILNGALEILPESLSTMAIIPIQLRMVYSVGKSYGYSLDRGHIREFLATLGLGITSQVVEGFARKLVGGLFGTVGGRVGRGIGDQLASSSVTFAGTYALGQAAKRYYAGGRKMSTVELKGLFSSLTDDARTLYNEYVPKIREQAKSLNLEKVMAIIKGQA